MGRKGFLEALDCRCADRFGTDDHDDVAQIQGLTGWWKAPLRGPFVGEVGCRGDYPALPQPSDNARIHRYGRRTNEVGDIKVECPP